MFEKLQTSPGGIVTLTVARLPRGTFAQFQPVTPGFLELYNPKIVYAQPALLLTFPTAWRRRSRATRRSPSETSSSSSTTRRSTKSRSGSASQHRQSRSSKRTWRLTSGSQSSPSLSRLQPLCRSRPALGYRLTLTTKRRTRATSFRDDLPCPKGSSSEKGTLCAKKDTNDRETELRKCSSSFSLSLNNRSFIRFSHTHTNK